LGEGKSTKAGTRTESTVDKRKKNFRGKVPFGEKSRSSKTALLGFGRGRNHNRRKKKTEKGEINTHEDRQGEKNGKWKRKNTNAGQAEKGGSEKRKGAHKRWTDAGRKKKGEKGERGDP